MTDLKLLGYTTEHFEAQLFPNVSDMGDNVQNTLEFNCQTAHSPDLSNAGLRIDLCVTAKNANDEDPFTRISGIFYFTFESNPKQPIPEVDAYLQTAGLQAIIPIIRGSIVGIAKMLNLPDVFSFPPINNSDVEWSDIK